MAFAVLFAGFAKVVHVHHADSGHGPNTECVGFIDHLAKYSCCCISHEPPPNEIPGDNPTPFVPDHDDHGCVICQFSIDEAWFVVPELDSGLAVHCLPVISWTSIQTIEFVAVYSGRAPPSFHSFDC